ncbi:MAG: hypothetical protein AB3K77_16585, partial [Methanosarcinaceae archaeon]
MVFPAIIIPEIIIPEIIIPEIIIPEIIIPEIIIPAMFFLQCSFIPSGEFVLGDIMKILYIYAQQEPTSFNA